MKGDHKTLNDTGGKKKKKEAREETGTIEIVSCN